MRMSFAQFSKYISWCETQLFGAQLQDVYLSGEALVLEFYKQHSFWLVCELNNDRPNIALLQNLPPYKLKTVKPIVLFIRSHGVNWRLQEFHGVLELGRVAELTLSSLVPNDQHYCHIQFQLVSHATNVIVRTPAKSLSLKPIRELKAVVSTEVQDESPLDPEQIERTWWDEHSSGKVLAESESTVTSVAVAVPEATSFLSDAKALARNTKAIDKKKKALEILGVELVELETGSQQSELIEYANTKASHGEIPASLAKFKGLSIDDAYTKVKKLNSKKEGIRDRLQKIHLEIEKLENFDTRPTETSAPFAVKQMQKVGASGRHLDLGDSVSAVIGKSAKDNIDLLRKARPFDLWVHIKDYPGAHGLIFRKKGQNVTREQIGIVFQRLLKESKNTRSLPAGVKLELLLTECRFVRPLKGDRMGRVTIQNAQVFLFASEA